MNTKTTNPYDQNRAGQPSRQPQAHFFIYENLAYVSDRCFSKERISIGRSPEADVVLDHQAVADIHALVHFEGEQAFLTNHYPKDGLRLNGRSVRLEALQHEDIIDIGPFSLKIKMPVIESAPEPVPETKATYSVRLVNRYDSQIALEGAAERLAKLLRAPVAKVSPLLARDHFTIKKDLDEMEATRWHNALLKAGISCDVQTGESVLPDSLISAPVHRGYREDQADSAPADAGRSIEDESDRWDDQTGAAPADASKDIETEAVKVKHHPESVSYTSQSIAAEPVEAEHPPALPSFTGLVEDEEDEDEEIWEAPFLLKEKIGLAAPRSRSMGRPSNLLQVAKTIGSSVVDLGFLKKGQKYHLDSARGRICLAHYPLRQEASVYLTPELKGFVENERGEAVADLDSYKTEAYLCRRNKPLYQIPLPEKGTVIVSDGGCQYRIALTRSMPSPHVAVAPAPTSFTWKHWAYSAGFHMFFLLCISVYLYFQAVTPAIQTPHFVKIDPSLLNRLESLKAPEPPKKEPPPPKPEPQQVAQRVEPAKPEPEKKEIRPARTASKPQKHNRKVATAAAPSRHPNAGGGFGEGNIKNRNINQTGILSVLGSASLGGPSEAIAAVTNLDAVPVPGASGKNFTVGGLKGSLGNGKIAVASGEIVQTKGSQQVLRSAGARGKGDVAALERGSTGRKQVQAMVTAKMSRTVKIEGGMSREMVKRVIDQHLEEITYCYETALMSNPSILGRIVFEWKILMDGRVGEIRIVTSNVNSHEIHGCIKSAIKSWQFPKPVGAEVIVSYPFVFDLVAF